MPRRAREVGIGFTALPVLYRYGGFGGSRSDRRTETFPQRRRRLSSRSFDGCRQRPPAMPTARCRYRTAFAARDRRRPARRRARRTRRPRRDSHSHRRANARRSTTVSPGAVSGRWHGYSIISMSTNWCLIHATHMAGTKPPHGGHRQCGRAMPDHRSQPRRRLFNAIELFRRQRVAGRSVPTATSRSIRWKSCVGSNTAAIQ